MIFFERTISAKFTCLILIINIYFTNSQDINNEAGNLQLPDYEIIKSSIENLPDSQCVQDLRRYLESLVNQEKWAMIMFDATVKFPYGLLHGNSFQLGNYDECIEVTVPDVLADNTNQSLNETSTVDSKGFQGQYCLAEVSVNMTLQTETQQMEQLNLTEEEIFSNRKLIRSNLNKMHWAMCLPSSCDANETAAFLSKIFEHAMPKKRLQVNVAPNDCYFRSETMTWTTGQIIYSGIIGSFLLLILLSTGYHCVHVFKKQHFAGYTINRTRADFSLKHEAILAFSLLKNIRKLVQIRAKNNDLNLDCICGIRTLSMGFILAGHALTFLVSSPSLNKGFTEDAIKKVQNAMFLNNPLLVDTFLLVSGFLMCRLLLIEMEKRFGRVNIFVMYIGRYIRLTPAYIVVIGFYCTFLVDIGDGPLWKSRMRLEQDRCVASWWTNILYVNNYVNTENLCMFQSWYLSVDTQLFVLGPLIVFPLWYKRILGEILIAILCIGSIIAPLMITISEHLDPTLMIYPEEINDLSTNFYFKNYYIKTHMRANAYVMGIVFGYVVHKMQCKNAKIPFIARILIGILAIMVGAGAMFSVVIFYQDDYIYNSSEAGLYSALHRVAWCFAIGWTLLVCVTSNSYVNNFLGWKAWGPFSKLTYCAYLVNGVVELYSYGQTRTPRYLSIYSLGCETAAHIVMTLILAFILCVLFESPIHNIEKLLLRKYNSRKSLSNISPRNQHVQEAAQEDSRKPGI